MASYRFLTIWVFDTPIERVWDVITDNQNLPTWWNAVKQVKQLESGDADGVGSVWQMTWGTPLSYSISFISTITRVEAPKLLELNAIGEVEGSGRWELESTTEGTLVRYYWTVNTTKAWMNLMAIFLKPLMEWNHNTTMRQGGQGLADYLGATLIREEALKPDENR
jgi:uncharacterized protein YndB with AHSA1/START domain